MVTKDVFIQKLNKALEWEYAATVQYIQHAAVLTGAHRETIAKELNVHAGEEKDHAIKVAAMINTLAGVPTVDVEKREIAADDKTMLGQDLAGEELAIELYQELIAIAKELKYEPMVPVLEGILKDELEHKHDLQKFLMSIGS